MIKTIVIRLGIDRIRGRDSGIMVYPPFLSTSSCKEKQDLMRGGYSKNCCSTWLENLFGYITSCNL